MEESARLLAETLCSAIGAALPFSRTPFVKKFKGADANQAVFARFSDCNLFPPAIQAGGSLAGKDSIDASSTMSSTSSSGGGVCGSLGAGGAFGGCFAIAISIVLWPAREVVFPIPLGNAPLGTRLTRQDSGA